MSSRSVMAMVIVKRMQGRLWKAFRRKPWTEDRFNARKSFKDGSGQRDTWCWRHVGHQRDRLFASIAISESLCSIVGLLPLFYKTIPVTPTTSQSTTLQQA